MSATIKSGVLDPSRCVAEVFSTAPGDFRTFQCRSSRGHGKDGMYCAFHAKDTKHITPMLNEKKGRGAYSR